MKPFLHVAGANVLHFQWNVDVAVGKGGTNNNLADVSYIQWYYSLAAENPRTDPTRREIYKRVALTGHCNGTDADPLVAAITIHQRGLNHPIIDGRISVAHGSGKIGDATAFFVLRLGARFADMYPAQWPRLDLISRCPPSVATAVKLCIPKITG